jgi:intein-encoded DNA endonuclease-like protein
MPIQKDFNKKFFKKWSSDMAYILGFLYADGNMVKTKRNTHFTALYTADYDLIYSIRDCLESNHKISNKKSKTGSVYVLQIGSKELFCDLGELGLAPNKARRMKLPKIPKKYQGDFVRGYFDGDGNVWSGLINKKRKTPTLVLNVAFTSACKEFIKNLFLLLQTKNIKGGCIYSLKNKNCYRLQYSSLDALKLYEIMYNRPCKLFLARKKLVFENFIKMRP